MEELIHSNHTLGGTMITNFNQEDIKIYIQAIEQYAMINPNHGLVISKIAYNKFEERMTEYNSLHQLKKCSCDLSEFWDIFDSIKYKKNKSFSREELVEKMKNAYHYGRLNPTLNTTKFNKWIEENL